jgi:hypothetical protein
MQKKIIGLIVVAVSTWVLASARPASLSEWLDCFFSGRTNCSQQQNQQTVSQISQPKQEENTNDTTLNNLVKSLNRNDKPAQQLDTSTPSKETVGEASDSGFLAAYKNFQQNPPKPFAPSILNQTSLPKGQSKFNDFASCGAQSGNEQTNTQGGNLSGSGKDCMPENQGGKLKNQIWYAIKTAADKSGAKIQFISCFRAGATITGSGRTSKHASGEAADVKINGSDKQKQDFLLAYMALTGEYNSSGYYEGQMEHVHLGGDCGPWCAFKGTNPGNGQTGGIPEWAKTGLLRAGLSAEDKSARPPKPEAQKKAQNAVGLNCGNSSNLPTS